jgi:endonuclease/exonuclease/phosphatase (EEP) superfamily protein YafD
MLANKPVKILAVYLSPSRPLIDSDLSAYFGSGIPVIMAGDLNAKHVEWNSRLSTRLGRLLRDYADRNSCLIYGPSTHTTLPYNPSGAPDVLDIVIAKDLVLPLHLTTCSALGSDHLPVLIDKQCRSPFLVPSDRPNVRKTD